MTLTVADKKRLTEFLGEKYHDYSVGYKTGELSRCSCGRTGCSVLDYCQHKNLPFTTPDDMMALKNRLAAVGKWFSFCQHVWKEFSKADTSTGSESAYLNWLLNPPRFCQLVSEFLKEADYEKM